MKKISIIILPIIVCACMANNRNEIPDGIEIIPVEVNKLSENTSSFLEKIELVPLETNDSSLLFKCNKVIYDKVTNIYAIYTSDQLVYTFSGNGTYIDNSKRMKGQGAEDYSMVLDIKLNPYLKGIDMLNPYGTIYTYSPTFELLSKRKYKSEFPVDYLMALDSNNYVFIHPFMWTDQEVTFINLEDQQVTNANYKGTISENTMAHDCFYNVGDCFYFVPLGLNYYFYQINTEEKKLVPIMYLDFGDYEVKTNGLPGRATGERTNLDMDKSEISREVRERYQFLKKSNNILPLLKFFNDDYVYVYLAKTDRGYGSHFIYNRKKKEGYLLKGEKPFLMYPSFAIVDNVLLAICRQPDLVPRFVDRNFMSPEEIRKMEQLKEDDNPVILKYYLK
ncbi:6-bladed beta-propeller [Bacteroides bouchesdurhonensis]|uniref:6-bladed beta-propeller n=1 Tax=Bacteroides bouchesdurhonensis TaxID=1841855 RepID=UPI00097F726F|nr:6-bladed beta-propeller [Bacteroides bouchesdurhonensis]